MPKEVMALELVPKHAARMTVKNESAGLAKESMHLDGAPKKN